MLYNKNGALVEVGCVHTGHKAPTINTEMVRKTVKTATEGEVTDFLVVVDCDGEEHNLLYNYEPVLRQLKRARHRNVVRLIEYHLDGQQLRLYFPYYRGGTLQKPLVSPRLLNPRCMSRALLGAWDGLVYVNMSMRLLHNDIKPANVFLHQETVGGSMICVLGDLDGAIPLHNSRTSGYKCQSSVQYLRTWCHGSPFADHCPNTRYPLPFTGRE